MMNTDEAFDCLAKNYDVPRELLVAQIGKLKDNNRAITNFALVAWLRERAAAYERGLGYYGAAVNPETLAEIALYKLCAERLEETTNKLNPPGPPIAIA